VRPTGARRIGVVEQGPKMDGEHVTLVLVARVEGGRR
jgi:hypothetical protein